ncbi:MAG: hypothetical protein DCC75_03825 [Proteobacteria bacterium]|nr:MAG: hypothetical protein DCC75_03825 [Pseudomonadota bacterium]
MLAGPGAARAADDVTPPKQPKAWEKCYGVVRAGQNDCSSLDGKHFCGGLAAIDADPNEYLWVPQGFCEKLTGGQLVEVTATKVKQRKLCRRLLKRKPRR